MATLQPNSFSSWTLTPEELSSGSKLNTQQLQVLQNKIAQFAEAKLAVEYDPQNPIRFAQTEAYLKGKIEAITEIIADSINQDLEN